MLLTSLRSWKSSDSTKGARRQLATASPAKKEEINLGGKSWTRPIAMARPAACPLLPRGERIVMLVLPLLLLRWWVSLLPSAW